MSVATMSADQAALAQEANDKIEAEGIRRVGHVEAARTLFSSVSGTGRTETGIELGKVLSNSLAEERSIQAKKKWLTEIAKQICGSYSDDKKLVEYIKLYHVSLRLPTLRQVGLTWAMKCISAMKTGFDWKSVTDDMTAIKIERAQYLLPLLHAGADGLGCDEKGNPSRKLWAQLIGYYLEHGEMPEAKPEAETVATAETGSTSEPTVSSATTVVNAEVVAAWMNSQNHENLLAMATLLTQETIESLFDVCDTVATRRAATPTTASTDKAITA